MWPDCVLHVLQPLPTGPLAKDHARQHIYRATCLVAPFERIPVAPQLPDSKINWWLRGAFRLNVDLKTNEIPFFSTLLATIELLGTLVTADAMHCVRHEVAPHEWLRVKGVVVLTSTA